MVSRLIVQLGIISLVMLMFASPLNAEGTNMNTQQQGTGILLNNGDSGEMYGGLRWKDFEDKSQWLTLRAGNGGVRIVTNDNQKELLAIDNFSGIYMNGDLYYNGKSIKSIVSEQSLNNMLYIIISLLIVIVFVFSFLILKMRKQLNDIQNRVKFGSDK